MAFPLKNLLQTIHYKKSTEKVKRKCTNGQYPKNMCNFHYNQEMQIKYFHPQYWQNTL